MKFWQLILILGLAGCIEAPPSGGVLNPGEDMDQEDMVRGDMSSGDMSVEDMGSGSDVGTDMPVCVPEGEEAACERLQRECGSHMADDNCGVNRAIECGPCGAGKVCLQDGSCDDPGLTDAIFCRNRCGTVDRDGRDVECGDDCEAPETCGAVFENRCGCKGESVEELCMIARNPCVETVLTDSCGNSVTTTCVNCVSPQTCTPEGVCGCTYEGNLAFCSRHGKECGSFTELDNCGGLRTVDCGMCTSPETCGDGANGTLNECVCVPESKEMFCSDRNATCGDVSDVDSCGTIRTENCGACAPPETCGGGGVANMCGGMCVPESDPIFCARHFKQCGPYSGTDNCGQNRMVQECGPCAVGHCNNGTCGPIISPPCLLECTFPEVCTLTPTIHCCDPNGPACM